MKTTRPLKIEIARWFPRNDIYGRQVPGQWVAVIETQDRARGVGKRIAQAAADYARAMRGFGATSVTKSGPPAYICSEFSTMILGTRLALNVTVQS